MYMPGITSQGVSGGSAAKAMSEEVFFDSEPIIAYRSWNLIPNKRGEPRLVSVTFSTHPWRPQRSMRARCTMQLGHKMIFLRDAPTYSSRMIGYGQEDYAHLAPRLGCQCGIHGVKDLKQALTWGSAYGLKQRVTGKVSLWGKVYEFEDGYRGEYAYPYEFYIPDEDFPLSVEFDFKRDEIIHYLKSFKVDLLYGNATNGS